MKINDGIQIRLDANANKVRSFAAWRERKKEEERCKMKTKDDCFNTIIITISYDC